MFWFPEIKQEKRSYRIFFKALESPVSTFAVALVLPTNFFDILLSIEF